jgi:hypothetical protein
MPGASYHRVSPILQSTRSLYLGAALPPLGGASSAMLVAPHHLVTHGVVLGMTGSGKTGLLMVISRRPFNRRSPSS